MSALYLIYTNVFLRAADTASAQHAIASSLLNRLAASGAGRITAQILVEFWAVATRSATANGLGWDVDRTHTAVSEALADFVLLPETHNTFRHWLALVTEHRITGKRVHDARLLAVMRSHGISHLLTFNTGDFPAIEGITVIAPADIV